MDKSLDATATVMIQAAASRVWEALTRPDLIKQYFFGADIVTDWTEGSPILYRGDWQGRAYEDKGLVLKVVPERDLIVTHWSPLSGAPDVPESYHTVSYRLSPFKNGTQVTITQTNNASDDERLHSEQNWNMVLKGLKNLLES